MFLNTNPEGTGIEEFLKSMNFMTPNGQELKYFIVPLNQNNEVLSSNAAASGFEPLANENQVPGVTDNIVYTKRDFKTRQSVSKPTLDPTEVPNEFPLTKEIEVPSTIGSQDGNMSTDVLIAGGAILPPGSGVKTVKPDANVTPIHVGNMPKPVMQQQPSQTEVAENKPEGNKAITVVESTEKNYDFILNESVGYFPANTLFHFTKD